MGYTHSCIRIPRIFSGIQYVNVIGCYGCLGILWLLLVSGDVGGEVDVEVEVDVGAYPLFLDCSCIGYFAVVWGFAV